MTSNDIPVLTPVLTTTKCVKIRNALKRGATTVATSFNVIKVNIIFYTYTEVYANTKVVWRRIK